MICTITEGPEYDEGLYAYLERHVMELRSEIGDVNKFLSSNAMDSVDSGHIRTIIRCMANCHARDLRDRLFVEMSRMIVIGRRMEAARKARKPEAGDGHETPYRVP